MLFTAYVMTAACCLQGAGGGARIVREQRRQRRRGEDPLREGAHTGGAPAGARSAQGAFERHQVDAGTS